MNVTTLIFVERNKTLIHKILLNQIYEIFFNYRSPMDEIPIQLKQMH